MNEFPLSIRILWYHCHTIRSKCTEAKILKPLFCVSKFTQNAIFQQILGISLSLKIVKFSKITQQSPKHNRAIELLNLMNSLLTNVLHNIFV